MSIKINITDKKVSDIVLSMAEHFETECEIDKNEHCIRVPENLGSGYIKTTEFANGLGIIESDYLLNKPLIFKLKKDIVYPLKFIFNRESTFKHKFEGSSHTHEIKRLENLIVSSNPQSVHEFIIPANAPICIFSLEINRKLFEESIEEFLVDMNEDLVKLFRDVNGINQFFYKGQYSLEISGLINEITDCELEGFMKSVFLESKTKEILILQLEQYLDDLNEPDKRKILRQATIESVKEAVKIIEAEIASIDNVVKLAKRVGLSANTLQQGFQVLYKMSVNEFIKDFRIEKAKELIETSAMNITEITYLIGINSRSYFSKLFKERYGITPKQYYNKKRISGNENITA